MSYHVAEPVAEPRAVVRLSAVGARAGAAADCVSGCLRRAVSAGQADIRGLFLRFNSINSISPLSVERYNSIFLVEHPEPLEY